MSLYAGSFTLRAVKVFQIEGSESTAPRRAYIDPLAKLVYTHRIYVFRTEGER